VEQDVIYVSSRGGWREEIGVEKYCSYIDLIDVRTGQFKFDEPYRKAHQKKESDRDERDKQILKLGERFEIMNTIFSQGWEYIKILPIEGDKGNKWTSILKQGTETEGFKLAVTYLGDLDAASAGNGNYRKALTSLNTLKKHQRKLGKDVVPSESDVRLEISYNKMNIFKNAEYSYLIIGVLFLLIFLVKVFASPTPGVEKAFKWISRILTATTIVIFVYHGVGLYMRSVISGHVPWANAYEAVLFIAWIAVLLGLLLSRVHPVILGAAAILAFFMLFVTELNLFDPEITTLQPVLKSYWLMIHVAIITGSYAPLGFSGILGLMNLVLYVFRTKNNAERISSHISILTYVSEIAMIVGVFMLTIGTFLGGIWANESWGRYWGWDPKETWALVAILVYAVLLHLRYIPSLKDKFTFNALSLWSYSSILFTFFGVNFYLVGLHSYANTEGLGELPSWLIYFVIVVYIFTEFSWVQNKLFQGKGKMVSFASFKKKLIILYAMYVLTGLMIWILGVSDLKTVSINSLLVIALIFATNAIMYGYAYLRTRNSSKAIS
jgi:cytochrome c-type biogenesis protein CcsB